MEKYLYHGAEYEDICALSMKIYVLLFHILNVKVSFTILQIIFKKWTTISKTNLPIIYKRTKTHKNAII